VRYRRCRWSELAIPFPVVIEDGTHPEIAPRNWNGTRMRNRYHVIAPDSHRPRPTAGL
jgi:hypothetical protein